MLTALTVVVTATKFATIESKPVLVVADDSDIAIMPLYHWKNSMTDIFFSQEQWNRAGSIKDSNISDIEDHMLILHSWSGCDTISSIFDKDKGNLVTTLRIAELLNK